MKVKAWLAKDKNEFHVTVVFAETRGKAKSIALQKNIVMNILTARAGWNQTKEQKRMNNFIELHLWDMDENKRNTPVLVNIGTIEQIMINCKAPTFIYFGAGDYLRVSETYEEVKQLLAAVEYVYKEEE